MPIYGNLTVDVDGFINFITYEIEKELKYYTKMLNESLDELKILETKTNYHIYRPSTSRTSKFKKAWNTITNKIKKTFNCNHTIIQDNELLQTINEYDKLINTLEDTIKILKSRLQFINTIDFKDKILGNCPICFEELVNKETTSVIPDCMHVICRSCFELIYQKQITYKCPMCCVNSTSFYEIWFFNSNLA